MLKYYARTFMPWLVLVAVSPFDRRVAARAGLVAAGGLLVADLRAGRKFDELILDLSTAVFMAIFAGWALAQPDSPVLAYGAALAGGWLAATAWLGLAVHRPFTAAIARRRVDEWVARTPAFERMNVIITMVWAICFTLESVGLAIVQYNWPHAMVALIVCKVGFLSAAGVFTARYPEVVRQRAQAGAYR